MRGKVELQRLDVLKEAGKRPRESDRRGNMCFKNERFQLDFRANPHRPFTDKVSGVRSEGAYSLLHTDAEF